jgi:putative protease
MKLISYIENKSEIKQYIGHVDELIVSTDIFSRFGKVKLNEIDSIAKEISQVGIKPVFDWDILATEFVFKNNIKLLESIDLTMFKAIRVQDPGAVEYIKEHYPDLKIQLVLENGHHNFKSIEAWVEHLGPQLERLVLSIELTKFTLEEYISKLSIPVELQILGRILLFYSARKLIGENFSSKNGDLENQSFIEVKGNSEESPHKGFPIIENRHGTFMFNPKDHGLLESIDDLKNMDLAFGRVDLRFTKQWNLLPLIGNLVENFELEKANEIKDQYSEKLIRGYFHANKTTKQFVHLKNSRRIPQNDNYIGEVVDCSKKNHIAIFIKNYKRSLKLHDEVTILTTEGKQIKTSVNWLRNTSHVDLDEGIVNSIVLIPYHGGVSVKSVLYFGAGI